MVQSFSISGIFCVRIAPVVFPSRQGDGTGIPTFSPLVTRCCGVQDHLKPFVMFVHVCPICHESRVQWFHTCFYCFYIGHQNPTQRILTSVFSSSPFFVKVEFWSSRWIHVDTITNTTRSWCWRCNFKGPGVEEMNWWQTATIQIVKPKSTHVHHKWVWHWSHQSTRAI